MSGITDGNDGPTRHYSALWELTRARLLEFFRVPEAVFWVYGFPLLLAVALGLAFRNRPVEQVRVDVISESQGDSIGKLVAALSQDSPHQKQGSRLQVTVKSFDDAQQRLQRGKTDLIVQPTGQVDGQPPTFRYWYEPNRPESVLARSAVDSVLLRDTLGEAAPVVDEQMIEQPGSRYIDFLVPGLLGMNLMGGGLWGVGFVTVDFRIRKLLKRFLATPMRRRDFLLSLMLSRLLFTIPEVLLLLGFAYLVFGVGVQGSFLFLLAVIILGAAAFSGIGLFVACRAKTVETVSGLMNLVMLPMFLFSGVFFSSERFPEVIQPLIQALPLTALNDALRGIMLDAAGPGPLAIDLGILAIWGTISFLLALRLFRWK